MAKVRLTAEVEPELRQQVEIAAASVDKSVDEWLESAITRELNGETRVNYVGDAKVTMSPPGVKPRGTKNPPRLKDGSSLSDVVLEDRR